MQQAEPRWFKSSYSAGQGTECVETAFVAAGVAVRDSKDPGGPRLGFAGAEWSLFVTAVRTGTVGAVAKLRH
ncbi:DUF397 domain-containing protein [Streptomyces sp. NBC_01262]|uniref:DUF397 domain-containing protein n=1 Tax=Streptomyces sp. NBC_01262 TaxID=2903803 RepID=UPI002E32F079|nr:DUF397 domain-containing protein [Streptomyces sp. NBC_01262]